jgi:hypothetical protein
LEPDDRDSPAKLAIGARGWQHAVKNLPPQAIFE